MELHDNSPMPFGKHKGKTMGNLSAFYLLFLYDKNYFDAPGGAEVKAYIISNLDALRKETGQKR